MSSLESRLALALLLQRLTLGIFFMQWGIEKLVVPATTTGIFQRFYGLEVGGPLPMVLGIAQCALALAFLLGLKPRLTYGAVLLLHTITTLVTIPRLLNPWNPVSNHFFMTGVPVLAAFFLLYLLRDADRYTLPRLLGRRAAMA
jgi:uncharacterized membrane protein YphA (DoxX/SURF4 family)